MRLIGCDNSIRKHSNKGGQAIANLIACVERNSHKLNLTDGSPQQLGADSVFAPYWRPHKNGVRTSRCATGGPTRMGSEPVFAPTGGIASEPVAAQVPKRRLRRKVVFHPLAAPHIEWARLVNVSTDGSSQRMSTGRYCTTSASPSKRVRAGRCNVH